MTLARSFPGLRLKLPFFVSVSALAFGCASGATPPAERIGGDEESITDVAQTPVERQSIGNCWIYAEASWVESLNKTATGADFDVSQSYWTYWHWYDQITGALRGNEVQTGGSFRTANNIVRKYGLVAEADFVRQDSDAEMSTRQKTALAAINTSLASGALTTSSARRNRALVRQELDKAWGLTGDVSAYLTTAFGAAVSKTFASSRPAVTTGTPIVRPQDFSVAYTTGPGTSVAQKKLSTAMSEWREVSYYAGSRSSQQRAQRALHDRQPVIISWYVDFNAMENGPGDLRGSFNMTTLNELGPGSQGGHMVVLEDYQAVTTQFGVLAAGVTLDPNVEGDKAKLAAALRDDTSIVFFRIKNSWGAARPTLGFSPGFPGYHDLYMDYLNGPIQQCEENAAGETDTTKCDSQITPLEEFILPPGY